MCICSISQNKVCNQASLDETSYVSEGFKGASSPLGSKNSFLKLSQKISTALLFSLQLLQRLACFCPVLGCFVKVGVKLFKAGG